MRGHNVVDPGNPGFFQLDCEDPDARGFDSWLEDRFTEFVCDCVLQSSDMNSDIFRSGKFSDIEVMLWLEPGYFIIIPLRFTFDYVQISRKAGKDVAPYQVTCQSSFEFPLGNKVTYSSTLRLDMYQQAAQAYRLLGQSITLLATTLFCSEVITE